MRKQINKITPTMSTIKLPKKSRIFQNFYDMSNELKKVPYNEEVTDIIEWIAVEVNHDLFGNMLQNDSDYNSLNLDNLKLLDMIATPENLHSIAQDTWEYSDKILKIAKGIIPTNSVQKEIKQILYNVSRNMLNYTDDLLKLYSRVRNKKLENCIYEVDNYCEYEHKYIGYDCVISCK